MSQPTERIVFSAPAQHDLTAWHILRAEVSRILAWMKQAVRFEQAAQEAMLLDYVHEVEHAADRVGRLERAITDAVSQAPPAMRAVIDALQALRGIALSEAVKAIG